MEREKFSSRLGFILISAGCAIGLGNVWRFPYIVGEYGGAAFVLVYLVFLLILGLPIFDTAFAFIRRIAHGQSPMHADRSHIHHRLIDMGLNQKQAVATLYVISAILGLSAVVLTTSGEQKAMLFFAALCIVAVVAARVVFPKEVKEELREELEELRPHSGEAEPKEDGEQAGTVEKEEET